MPESRRTLYKAAIDLRGRLEGEDRRIVRRLIKQIELLQSALSEINAWTKTPTLDQILLTEGDDDGESGQG